MKPTCLLQETLKPLMQYIQRLSRLERDSTPQKRMVILQVLLCKLIDVLDDAVPWDVGAKYDVNRGEEPQYIPRDARLMPMVSRLSLAQKQWLSSQLFMQGAEAQVAHLSWFE
ncbi:MAG: hypothetical protein WDW36_008037 [Sanguina aurantia]